MKKMSYSGIADFSYILCLLTDAYLGLSQVSIMEPFMNR